jgi:Phytanoyl-CoA dioxygenase (PhyH)
MFYSGIQQLLRQDPAWYAILVAARPDNQFKLISYPYVAKQAEPGMHTSFLHMDINIKKFLEHGIGANQLTTSLSLDTESAAGCTLVVPGFFRHIQEWHQRRIQRSTAQAGTTTDAAKSYTPEDERDFGKPVPCPCPAGGVRVTLPNIIHGSTKSTDVERRVIYTWLTSISDDHQTLEIPGQLSWDQIAACHRDLEAPTRGVGGEAVTHERPPFRFPAAILLDSSAPLCDALIGRRKWTDPMVLKEACIVLGSDHIAAKEYVKTTRAKLVANYLASVREMLHLEPDVFPNDSYVLQHPDDPYVHQQNELHKRS